MHVSYKNFDDIQYLLSYTKKDFDIIAVNETSVVVITTSQLHSTKSELRFCTGSNPAHGVL